MLGEWEILQLQNRKFKNFTETRKDLNNTSSLEAKNNYIKNIKSKED